MCIGFLAVFGFAAYAIVLLLIRAFDKNQEPKNNENNTNQKQTKEENGN